MKHLLKSSFILFTIVFAHQAFSSACQYQDDPELQAQKQACETKATSEWSCELNRCMTTQESVDTRKNYQACAEIQDETQRKDCLKQLADNEVQIEDLKDLSGSDNVAVGVNGAFAALNLINMATSKSKNTCKSAMIATGAGVVGVLGYAYIKLMAEKKLKDLRKNYQKEALEGDPYAAQLKAFEYLRDEQLAIRDLARTRRNTYIMTGAAYGVASAMAIVDKLKGGVCSETGPNVNKFSGFLNNGLTIAVMSGAAATYSGLLAYKAAKQANEAEENAKTIEQVMANFSDSLAQFCPQGHDNISEARCYCYTADNKKNEGRSNSQTCQQLWASDERNLDASPTDYSIASKAPKMGCITAVTREFDTDCQCRDFRDQKGNNACYKSTVASISGIGQSLGVPQITSATNGLTQGRTTPGNLSVGSLAKLAKSNKDKTKQLIDTLNRELASQGANPLSLGKDVFESLIKDHVTPTEIRNAENSALAGLNQARPQTGAIAQALKKALSQTKSALKKTPKLTYSSNKRKTRKKNSPGFKLNFSNQADLNNAAGQELNFMNKEYDYKANDIVENNDVTLWQIISNRYTQTGLRRLFDNEI